MGVSWEISRRQLEFIRSEAHETLFGGAAGGGKSFGQIIDAFLYAVNYPHSKQLILRRTYKELERSIIRTSLDVYPREVCRYNDSKHTMKFANGSLIDYGYCENEKDVLQYQSAEYDVIRFDELTHFSAYQYEYMFSRCRGANDFPKYIKSSTNPGAIGHFWVKQRFIDAAPADQLFETPEGTRIFIPSKIDDNVFLMRSDPGYKRRLLNLPKKDREQLLGGNWDVFDGQYFPEFRREIHVIKPFQIPTHWFRYRVFDYGLDMLACYWIAMDTQGRAYVYRELYESGLIISAAAKKILEMTPRGEEVLETIAPPDMWNRRQETGRSAQEIFAENGVPLCKAANDRVQGWYDLKEWMKPGTNEFGNPSARLRIFENCVNLIRCLPAVMMSERNPNDVATEPHENTHAPDALRYFAAGRPVQTMLAPPDEEETRNDEGSFINYGR